MIIKPIHTAVFQEGENLLVFINRYIKKIPERSILVVTSKIAALAENRTSIIENEKTKERLIKKESRLAIPTKYVWLTIKDGLVMPSAGIDESNANGKLVLLPRDSFKTAHTLWTALKKKHTLKQFGILITDSHTMPMRAGVIALALGYAGFSGIKSYIGSPDIFGRKFHFSNVNVADSLATAAAFTMGEGREQQPLAVISDLKDIKFITKVNKKELHINLKDDMYLPLFTHIKKKNK